MKNDIYTWWYPEKSPLICTCDWNAIESKAGLRRSKSLLSLTARAKYIPPFPTLLERAYLSRYFGNKGGSQPYSCIHTGTYFVNRCVQWCRRIDRFQLVDCTMHSRISPHGRRVNLFYSPVTFRGVLSHFNVLYLPFQVSYICRM